MPVKRRAAKLRANDFEVWACTLGTGLDFFGELPADDLEDSRDGMRSCVPKAEAVQDAWERHGARFLIEKAASDRFGNGSAWALWAFGPPPNADADALAANVASMRADWDASPGWADREQALRWHESHRQGLRQNAHFTGSVPAWVAALFGDLK